MPQVGAGLPGPPHAKHGPVPLVPWLTHSWCAAVPSVKTVLQYLAQALLPPLAPQAAPGKDASAPPTRAAPMSLSALRLETVPSASPIASSSKECPPVVQGLLRSLIWSVLPKTRGGALQGLASKLADASTKASGDELPMNPWQLRRTPYTRSSQNLPSTHSVE